MEKWYNRSFLQPRGTFLYSLGKAIGEIFDPVIWAIGIEIFIILIDFSFHQDKNVESYKLLHFFQGLHHLTLPPLVTIVGLYSIFKEPRPNPKIGTIYGMPSGDSIFGGIVSSVGFVYTGFYSFFIVFILVSYSRVVKGYHSILQVIVGSLLGIIIGFLYAIPNNPQYSISNYFPKNFNNVFTYFNCFFAAFLPLLIFFDKKSYDTSIINSYSNLHQWVIIDFTYVIFDFCFCFPDSFYYSFDEFFYNHIHARLNIGLFIIFIVHSIGGYMGDNIVLSFLSSNSKQVLKND